MSSGETRGRGLIGGARLRILSAFLVLLTFSTVVANLALRQILLGRVGERVELSLEQEVDEFRQLVGGNNPETGEPFGGDVEAIFDVFLARNIPAQGEAIFTFVDGAPHSTTADATQTNLVDEVAGLGRITSSRSGDIDTRRGRVRYLAVPIGISGRQRGVFVISVALDQERAEVTDAMKVSIGVSLAVLLLASALAYVVAGRVLAPLRSLGETARSISETDLGRRIEVTSRDEIGNLALTFNEMLDRLESAFTSQKEFISDAGHELRTPITIIRGHLELLGDDPDERRETIELVTDELDRMARFVDDLLLLAKAEQPDFVRPGDVDLDVLTEELMSKASALAPRDWHLDERATGRIRADRQRLTQAMMQLAVNAVQHTEPGDRIAVGSRLDSTHAQLWVADNGPGVRVADRHRIFDRFARGGGGGRRSEGAGLGLAIVRAIADAHGGSAGLADRDDGATFILTIPVSPPKETETR